MRASRNKIFLYGVAVLALLAGTYLFLAHKSEPERIVYGASFNTLYARELGLDWRRVYDAMLDDLGVRHIRLAAHWNMIEPQDDEFNFEELDYQVSRATARGADIILGIGERLPRWPECHTPDWATSISEEKKQREILEYMTEVVERYRDVQAITHWQVENEPFLTVFAYEHCGDLDEAFLDKELALVRDLDPERPILMTDSGNLGTWAGAYQRGDAFGTSLYRYLWNPDLGPFKSRLPVSFYRAKEGVMELFYGDKPTFLIELSAEPWLLQSVTETPVETQLERMNIDKFNESLEFARNTHLSPQYLWGVEWWYWMRERGQSQFWQRAQEIYEAAEIQE